MLRPTARATSAAAVGNDARATDFRSLTGDELRRSKRAYVTARFDLTRADRLLTAKVSPKAGDLLLARVARLPLPPLCPFLVLEPIQTDHELESA